MKTINIGGKERPVKYNMNALIEFDELTGIDLAGGNADGLAKVKNIRAFAYVGLKHGKLETSETVDFTLSDVGKWLSLSDGKLKEFYSVLNSDALPDGLDLSDNDETGKK